MSADNRTLKRNILAQIATSPGAFRPTHAARSVREVHAAKAAAYAIATGNKEMLSYLFNEEIPRKGLTAEKVNEAALCYETLGADNYTFSSRFTLMDICIIFGNGQAVTALQGLKLNLKKSVRGRIA